MMMILYLLLAIIFLTLGHIFKTNRWKKFIDIYEDTDKSTLYRSLSIGYILNFIFPFRLGDIFRIVSSGRKMKNGISFSFGTVLLDRYLDVVVIGMIFSIFVIFGVNNNLVYDSALFYMMISFILVLLMFMSYLLNRQVKKLIKKFAGMFNKNIEYKILRVVWAFITSFKDMIFSIDRIIILTSTIAMWFSYLLSYSFLSMSLSKLGNNVELLELIVLLFSKDSLVLSSLSSITNIFDNHIIFMFIYLLVPLFILIIYSFKVKEEDNNSTQRLKLLPQATSKERKEFLESYFSGDSRNYINNYLKINRDVTIIKDCTAGSGAKTILCTQDNVMFYRKFAFDNVVLRLKEQATWLKKQKNLKFTEIIKENYVDNCFYYDMPYIENSIDYFSYIHSHTVKDNFNILKRILEDLNVNLYTGVDKVKKSDIESYIKIKVIDNINYIKSLKEYKDLFEHDYLIINGKEYKNINLLEKYISLEKLYDIFENDINSSIHGDLTIDNIICIKKSRKADYYLIDPNPSNLLTSKYMDYGKILQSLHGGYEFLREIKNVNIDGNSISYVFTKSKCYTELYSKYVIFLENNFDYDAIKSIYFHEIIHWLRLLPYKSKDYVKFVVSYTRFIIVLNEIIDMYGVDKHEK